MGTMVQEGGVYREVVEKMQVVVLFWGYFKSFSKFHTTFLWGLLWMYRCLGV